MKKYIEILIKAIFAGIMIAMGGVIYLSLDNKIIGAIFFSIGLLVVCMYGMNLYTGKIGYLLYRKKSYLIELLLTLIGNYLGTLLVSILISNTRYSTLSNKALILSDIKLNDNLISILILSFFCGILMFIAVNSYNKEKNIFSRYIPIFMCVIVFILSGFEHCVANMFYFNLAGIYTSHVYLYLLIMIIGNSLGGILFASYYNYFIDSLKETK